MPRRKKIVEPEIDLDEIERLRELVAKEEELEMEMRRDLRAAIKSSDKKVLRELHRMENKNRRLIMWIGVTVLMLMLVAFWVSKLDIMIARPLSGMDKTQDFNLNEASANMQTTVQEVIKGIEEIKKQAAELEAQTNAASSSNNTFNPDTKLP